MFGLVGNGMKLWKLTGKRMARKKKPKDVNLGEEEENLQPSPIPVYPKPWYRRKNRGEQRAEQEKKRRRKPEYPGIREE